MVDSSEIITKSARETQELGEKIANSLSFDRLSSKGATVLTLYGDLGSGKTTFIQGLAKGLGIDRRVLSPTFVIMREYRIMNHKFYHLDLYRIQSEHDVDGLGLGEIMADENNIVAIEWPEKIANLLPKNRIEIHFEYLGEDERKIRIVQNVIPD